MAMDRARLQWRIQSRDEVCITHRHRPTAVFCIACVWQIPITRSNFLTQTLQRSPTAEFKRSISRQRKTGKGRPGRNRRRKEREDGSPPLTTADSWFRHWTSLRRCPAAVDGRTSSTYNFRAIMHLSHISRYHVNHIMYPRDR